MCVCVLVFLFSSDGWTRPPQTTVWTIFSPWSWSPPPGGSCRRYLNFRGTFCPQSSSASTCQSPLMVPAVLQPQFYGTKWKRFWFCENSEHLEPSATGSPLTHLGLYGWFGTVPVPEQEPRMVPKSEQGPGTVPEPEVSEEPPDPLWTGRSGLRPVYRLLASMFSLLWLTKSRVAVGSRPSWF